MRPSPNWHEVSRLGTANIILDFSEEGKGFWQSAIIIHKLLHIWTLTGLAYSWARITCIGHNSRIWIVRISEFCTSNHQVQFYIECYTMELVVRCYQVTNGRWLLIFHSEEIIMKTRDGIVSAIIILLVIILIVVSSILIVNGKKGDNSPA